MLSYREASLGDLPSLCRLGEEVNALHHAIWPHVFASPGSPERHREHWSQSVGRECATTFVADNGGCIVGFVTVSVVTETHSLFQPQRYARVGSVGVDASHRKRGIGSSLVALAEQWAVQRGAEEIRLVVWAFNEAAMAMYGELGYEVRSHLLGKPVGGTSPEDGRPGLLPVR